MSDPYSSTYSPKYGTSYTYGGKSSRSTVDPILHKYAKEEKAKQQKRKIQPLKMLFDILSRPQYVTANIAEEVSRSIQTGEPIGQAARDVITGIWQGLTGERKGDWEKILFGGQAEGGATFTGWFPGAGEQLSKPLIKLRPGAQGEERGILRPSKWIGLAANIVMDPTSWVGLGPAKAAKASARQFAEDAVKVATKEMSETGVPRIIMDTLAKIDPSSVKNVQQLAKRIVGKANPAKALDDLYKQAYKTALKTPGTELRSILQTSIDDLPRIETPDPMAMAGITEEAPFGLEELMKRIANPQSYGGGGKRAVSVLGREFNIGVRQPNIVERSFETVKSAINTSTPGQKVSDAWWAVMNKGPIGALRRSLGFRNPYATILHLKDRSIQQGFHTKEQMELRTVNDVLGKLSRQEQNELGEIIDKAWVAERARRKENAQILAMPELKPMWDDIKADEPITVTNILNNPVKYGIKQDAAVRLRGVAERVQELTRRWRVENERFVKDGSLPEFGELLNYVPKHERGDSMYYVGSHLGGKQPFVKRKTQSIGENVEEARLATDLVFGDVIRKSIEGTSVTYKEALDKFITDHGFANISTDFYEMMMHRAVAQSRAWKRNEMVRSFREFGIPIDELSKNADGAAIIYNLERMGSNGVYQGLKKASDPAFAGYVFDAEAADIINRVYAATTDPRAKEGVKLGFTWLTQWWKSMVTLSPGFHVRNWLSNEMTSFIKSGVKAFDPRLIPATTVGTIYAMHPDRYVDLLKSQFKVSDGWIARKLNERIGDKTVRELADEAMQRGVLGFGSQGFDLPEDILSLTKGNQLNRAVGTENIVFRTSRKIGNTIESSSKFRSFLMDYQDVVKGGASGEEALQYAAENTKKWFIDYGDLTDTEKKYLRPIIPFYSWLRKNIANQLTGFVLYPSMYNVVGKAMETAANDEGLDYSLVPDYLEQQGAFQVSTDPMTGYPMLFKPDFPFKDVNLIPLTFEEGSMLPRVSMREMTDDLMQSVHPMIKTIMAIAPDKGWNFFKRRDIKRQESAPPLFQYLAKSPKAIGFLDTLLRTAGFEEGLKVDLARDNTKVLIDGKVAQILENNLPALRMINNMIDTTKEVGRQIRGEAVDEWIEELTGQRDYYVGLESLLRAIGRFGVKFTTINEDYYEPIMRQQALDAARARKSQEEYNAITAQTRRVAYQRSRDATLRRFGLLQ